MNSHTSVPMDGVLFGLVAVRRFLVPAMTCLWSRRIARASRRGVDSRTQLSYFIFVVVWTMRMMIPPQFLLLHRTLARGLLTTTTTTHRCLSMASWSGGGENRNRISQLLLFHSNNKNNTQRCSPRFHTTNSNNSDKDQASSSSSDHKNETTLLNHDSSNKYNHEIEIRMPDMGEGRGKVIKWYKKEGDVVGVDDVLCDIETPDFVFGMETEDEKPSIMGKILVPAPSEEIEDGHVICTLFYEGDKKENNLDKKHEQDE